MVVDPAKTEKPRRGGAPGSRPVSRILSRAAIHLGGPSPTRSCRRPGTRRAASSSLLGVAPGGACRADPSPGRWCALTAPFHPCLRPRGVTSAVCFLLRFPSGFPAWELPSTLPCGVRTFLTARGRAAARPARGILPIQPRDSPRSAPSCRCAPPARPSGSTAAHASPSSPASPASRRLGPARGRRLARPADVRHRARRRPAGRRPTAASWPSSATSAATSATGCTSPSPSARWPTPTPSTGWAPSRRTARASPSPTRPATAWTSTSPSSISRRASAARSRSPAAGASRPTGRSAASWWCAPSPTPTTRSTSSIRRRAQVEHLTPHEGDVQYGSPHLLPDGSVLCATDLGSEFRRLAVLRDGRARVPHARHRRRGGDRGPRRAAGLDGQRGGLRARVLDGEPVGGLPDGVPGGLAFSPDGERAGAARLAAGRHDRRVGGRARPPAAPRHALGPRRPRAPTPSSARSSSAWRASTAWRCPTCATARATPRRCAGCTAGRSRRSGPALNAVVQYLVARGLTVAAPNVRGSTGYGRTYEHLDDVEKPARLGRRPRRPRPRTWARSGASRSA